MAEKREFTLEEIRILESNKYTLFATPTKLIHTKEFKEMFLEMYNQGIPPRKIFKELGYDVELLGKRRSSMYPTRLKEELQRRGSFKEDKPCDKLKPPKSTAYEQMKDKKAIKEMQAELKYLRQELDFLKKIIELDNTKK